MEPKSVTGSSHLDYTTPLAPWRSLRYLIDPMLGVCQPDSELLAEWSRGNTAAGQALFERHFSAVYRFFAHRVDGPVVQDLVQQTLLGCLEARHRFRGDASFRTFLFQIARHQLYAYLRQSRHDRAHADGLTSVRDLGTSPTGVIARHDERRTLIAALQRLPIELQLVLELTFWEELPAADVAAVLDIAENTVYTRVHRAKALLRHALRERTGASRIPLNPEFNVEARMRSMRPVEALKSEEIARRSEPTSAIWPAGQRASPHAERTSDERVFVDDFAVGTGEQAESSAARKRR
jgi:RNA polymerase sigma factor (sigma-70 family)